jgi:hypothetical protein
MRVPSDAKPLSFKPEMVRALFRPASMGGPKTQTRRLIVPQPRDLDDPPLTLPGFSPGMQTWSVPNPKYRRGDLLYVREALERGDWEGRDEPVIYYGADQYPVMDGDGPAVWRWKVARLSAIFLPKDLCRTLLRVDEVRVQRVKSITEQDAQAEGVTKQFRIDLGDFVHRRGGDAAIERSLSYRVGFLNTWDEYNGARPGASLRDNPLVYALTFHIEQTTVDMGFMSDIWSGALERRLRLERDRRPGHAPDGGVRGDD